MARPGRPKIPMVTKDLKELESKLPSKVINMEQVFYWMDLDATEEEIAGSFHVSVDTLNTRLKEKTGLSFSELKKKVCGQAKINVRSYQYTMAKKSATMAIWLGKQWLGQTDKIEDPTLKHKTVLDTQEDLNGIIGKED